MEFLASLYAATSKDNRTRVHVQCGVRYSSNDNGFYFNVSDCSFVSLHNSDDGGAIFIYGYSDNNINLLNCYRSIFANCSSDTMGGAILFEGHGAVYHRICAMNCNCESHGQFLISTSLSHTFFNIIHEVTVANCPADSSLGDISSVYFENGNQTINFFNSSNNHVRIAGASIEFAASDTTHVFLSTLYNNSGASRHIFFLSCTNSEISLCNIVANCQTASNEGTICAERSTLLIEACAIFYNKGGQLFEVSNGNLTAYKCAILTDYPINQSMIAQCVFTFSPTSDLFMYSCHAMTSLVTATPNANSKSSTVIIILASVASVLVVISAVILFIIIRKKKFAKIAGYSMME